MSDLKDFLESIRKHSDKIGETAMKQVGSWLVTDLPLAFRGFAYTHNFSLPSVLILIILGRSFINGNSIISTK